MGNWKVEYQRKMTTAEKAVKVVKSGDRIIFSHACGEPRTLPGELVKRAKELRNIEIVHRSRWARLCTAGRSMRKISGTFPYLLGALPGKQSGKIGRTTSHATTARFLPFLTHFADRRCYDQCLSSGQERFLQPGDFGGLHQKGGGMCKSGDCGSQQNNAPDARGFFYPCLRN